MVYANNHTTAFTYDEQNQLTKVTNPLNEQRIYSYDINRNLSMIVTPNGAQIKLYNNPANLVERKILPEGDVTYSYDGEYNLTGTTNTDSALNFIYDSLGRLIVAQTAGPAQPATSISYGYDLNNNLISLTDPAGIVTKYVYDTLNRLNGVTDGSDVYISSYTYDALNRRVEKKLLNISTPLTTNYTYDIASQLLSITNLPTTISDSYTYDNIGNRLSMTDLTGIHNYTYDNVYRLLNSTNPGETYNYDPVGNRNPLTQTYDAGNRLLDDGTNLYTYDHDGNMTSKKNKTTLETTTYSYNSEDQLIGVVTPAQMISYKYDALGRRIEKNVGGTITRYVYDGEDIIQELDGNNQVIATYTHGPGVDEPILLEKNGEKYFYVSDGLGSITAIVDANGNVVNTYRFDSFGNVINSTGSLNQPYAYTGREFDSETGLYQYRARYYDPHIGRFLQQDPIGFAGGINFYAYVGNNPVNHIDPLGLASLEIRPLNNDKLRNTTEGNLHHNQFFFDKPVNYGHYKNINNLGFFGDNRIRPDDAYKYLQSQYVVTISDLDDDILLQAINDVSPDWRDYGFGSQWRPWNWRNCQDFTAAVLQRYYYLKSKNKGGKSARCN